MKIFEIVDEENKIQIGVLLYFEKEASYVIELHDGLDEWTAPLMFTAFIKKGIYTIPRDISLMWIRERVIPNSRQNIGDILRNHRLKEYDEMKLLELSHGRCSQDSLCIKKANELPGYVKIRMQKNIKECVPCEDGYLLCFFANDTIRKISLNTLNDVEGIDKILKNEAMFRSCKTASGGYYVTFNDSIDIPAATLHGAGTKIPLKPDDFSSFVRNNVLDTTQACEILECTRQNLQYMVKNGQLNPLRENVKGNLYLKGDLLRDI